MTVLGIKGALNLPKWMLYGGIIVFFAVCIVLMTASDLLKYSWVKVGNRWQDRLDTIGRLISEESWDEAAAEVIALEKDWRSIMPYIQFAAELDEFRQLEQQFIRLKTALKYEDPLQADQERMLIENSLNRLGT